MEFLQTVFGTEALTYEQFAKKVDSAGLKLADLANGDYVDANKFKALETERDKLSTQVTERNRQIAELGKSNGDAESLQKQITELQKNNSEAAKKHDEEVARLRREVIDTELLTAAKAKNIKMAKALLSTPANELDDDGYRKFRQDEIKALTEAEDSKFAFETSSDFNFKGTKPGQGMDDPKAGENNAALNFAKSLAKGASSTQIDSPYFKD